MSLYLNELAPWERKNEYYNNIQLGKDVRTQTEVISRSTQAMVAAQMASTSAIIASQERSNEGVDNLAYGVKRVEQGIYGLQAAFEWGISEVVWQIEQNREELRSILEVLSAPLDTQAKELRKRAEEAYANGWFEDSLEDFFEYERKNRYDFSIHISVGMIYLFNKIDKEKALEYFDKAIKYATPKSKYHTSFALLHKALIKRDFGLLEEAEACAREAVELSPDFSEALYQCAQYNALLNRPDKSMELLTEAIMFDENYCEKACNDGAFDQFRLQLSNVFEDFRRTEGDIAHNKLAIVTKRIEKLDNLLNETKGLINVQDGDLRKCMIRITELIKRNSYRDYIEANGLIKKAQLVIDNLRSDITGQLQQSIKSHNAEISETRTKNVQKVSNAGNKFNWIMILGVIISVILGLRGCWVKGPGAMSRGVPSSFFGDNSLFGAFWALIWITALGIAISWGIYKAATSAAKSSANREATYRIAHTQYAIDRLNGYINNLKGL